MFTYDDKIIIKYLRQKFGYGANKIMHDHPERNTEWTEGGLKTLLKHIDEAGMIVLPPSVTSPTTPNAGTSPR